MSGLTVQQRYALMLLRRSRKACPSTDDGVVASCATFYDREIDVAYVNWRTADALARKGRVRFGHWYGPEEGREIVLLAEASA